MEYGLRQYLIRFQEWTEKHCAPVFFRDEEGLRCGGSMTFINTGEETLGVTARHVADRILECYSDKAGYGCQVGGADFDPSRLIARHGDLDLATFRLSEVFMNMARHFAISAVRWPPSRPRAGEKALIGGYPGVYREEIEGKFDIRFAHFGVSVSSVSERQFGMVLNLANATGLSGETIAPNIDLGGCSGGGVFRVVEDGPIARLEPMGIYFEGSADYGIAFAHDLSSLRADGTFLE
jgi:hypothetical protein